MNSIVSFRLCKLSDQELLEKVDKMTGEMYQKREIPERHIPAKPDIDYDLLVGELIMRFSEKINKVPKAIKTAPFQKSDYNAYYPSCKITWDAHLEAYKAYSHRYGTSQSAERIAERGGFGDNELDEFYPEWRNYIVE